MVICGVPVRISRMVMTCPSCGIEGWVVSHVQSSPYYSNIYTCTNCGDRWDNEELFSRPFKRGWRQESIRKANEAWEEACECPQERDWDMDGWLIPCEHQTRVSGCVS